MTVYKLHLEAGRETACALADHLSEWDEGGPPAASAFESHDDVWAVNAYFDTRPDIDALQCYLSTVADVCLIRPLSLEPLPDEDWVAKSQEGLCAVNAGRFVVHGSHERGTYKARLLALEIDAGQAFGTAHHGTTKGCLLAIDVVSRRARNRRILDLGTGTGVLALACTRLHPDARIIASDLDPIAVKVARQNAKANGLGGRVTFVCSKGLDHPIIRMGGPFDLIVANILAAPLMRLAPDIAAVQRNGGTLILSGILEGQTRSVVARYSALGYSLQRKFLIEGWRTLVMRRR